MTDAGSEERPSRAPHAPYRARHLLLPPGLLSLARVPLALAFPFVVTRPFVAFGVLIAAGATDVLDGWLARRFGWVTPTGAIADGITDKVFVATVAVTLVVVGDVSIVTVVALSTREIGELPLVLWLAWSPSARARRGHPSANVLGKVATLLQFVTVSWVLLQAPGVAWCIATTAVAGAIAALGYWARALRRPR
jgi:phosphatidylglycerophosphate synthase